MATLEDQDHASLAAGPFSAGELRVVSYRVRESLSRPTRITVVVAATADLHGHEADLALTLAVLTVRAEAGITRRFEGVVTRVRSEAFSVSAASAGGGALTLTLVSPLGLLAERRQSRIFQDLSVPDVLRAVLEEAGYKAEVRLSGSYPVRRYVAQYRETDLAFIERLAAEESLAYFIGDAAAEVPSGVPSGPIVFVDDAALSPCLGGGEEPGVLPFRPDDGLGHERLRVREAARSLRARPNAIHVTDYDFRRPTFGMNEKSRVQAPGGFLGQLEVFHHHADHDEPDVTPERAARALASERRGADRLLGASAVVELRPGLRFHLEADAAALSGDRMICRVDHEGGAPERGHEGPVYTNRFVASPGDVLERPRAVRRRPRQTLETATVVGPVGEQVHTDVFGRVKVQMHWDRRSFGDERASAWVRVAQGWAGASFGMQLLPRVGMEVLIGFLGGDPDCPVVMACLYNATHPPPFSLPAEKLTSGLRTQSVPSGGNNELSFDDAAGREKIFLNATRDLEIAVTRDRSAVVQGADRSTVTGSRVDIVAGARTLQTAGGVLAQTAGNVTEEVAGQKLERVGAGRFSTVFGGANETIKGTSLLTVEKEASVQVRGDATVEIGTDAAPATLDLLAWGDGELGAGKWLRLRAKEGIVLTSGESRVEIGPQGIVLSGPSLTLAATKSLLMKGDGPSLSLGKDTELVSDSIRLYAKKGSLELDEDAHVNGRFVKLNCGAGDPADATDEEGNPTTQKLSITLTDASFEPYANKEYIVRAGGVKVEGTTDGDGKLEVELPKEATSADITLWLEPRPTGKTRRYVVKLAELPPPDAIAGLEARLRNLGYYWGKEATEVTGDLQKAVVDFQRDHELEPTGELDAATKGKLVELHGG
jgi:type VI secretion system secreted protein VgrG